MHLYLFIRSAGNIEKRFGKHKMAMATTMAPAKDEVTVLEHATLKVSVIKLLDLVPRLAEGTLILVKTFYPTQIMFTAVQIISDKIM